MLWASPEAIARGTPLRSGRPNYRGDWLNERHLDDRALDVPGGVVHRPALRARHRRARRRPGPPWVAHQSAVPARADAWMARACRDRVRPPREARWPSGQARGRPRHQLWLAQRELQELRGLHLAAVVPTWDSRAARARH